MTTPPTNQDLFDLHGKAALVTGAAKGIGLAIARRLARAGARVTLADVEVPDLDAAAIALRKEGHAITVSRCDVARRGECEKTVDEALAAFGRLDVLVNNAGIFPMCPALEIDEQAWDRVLAVNLKGAFFLAQRAAHEMVRRGEGGAILNVASVDAFHPSGALAHYDASKAALVMLTRSLALELAPRGVRVNALAPGGVRTPGVAVALERMLPTAREAVTARIPMKRLGDPDEMAAAALFLVTRASSYVTGSTLIADGGLLLA